jgi:hypothetical protein
MIYYADKYDVFKLPLPDKEYEVLNELKSPHRSDDNCLYHTRFLFEFDSMPLQDQWNMVKDSWIVRRVVFSGKKSLHIIVEFDKKHEGFCAEHYKTVWRWLNDHFFNSKADTQCTNPSRLTRRPGVIRKDTNKEQKLLLERDVYVDEDTFADIEIDIMIAERLRKNFETLVRRYRSYMETGKKVDCSTWNVVRRYLETPFPHMTGNGNSSSWLYSALQTCKEYGDETTMQRVIDKALSENWTMREIQHKLK